MSYLVLHSFPTRRSSDLKATIDFGFVREEVARCYGKKGNESVDPVVILKMMFLLFFDDIKSERELMEVIGERLDYLWFLEDRKSTRLNSSHRCISYAVFC